MAEVLLFHHAQGLTTGVEDFADDLRRAGHVVHIPDLTTGIRSTASMMASPTPPRSALARSWNAGARRRRAHRTGLRRLGRDARAESGADPTRCPGALFFHACLPVEEFGSWSDDVAVQIHGMDADSFFVEEGDLDAARALVDSPPTPSCFCIRATSTCSPTEACRHSTSKPPPCSPNALGFLASR